MRTIPGSLIRFNPFSHKVKAGMSDKRPDKSRLIISYIAALRKKFGYSIDDFAFLVDSWKSCIHRFENCKCDHDLRLRDLIKYTRVLCCKVSIVIEYDGKKRVFKLGCKNGATRKTR
jgi:hypothetical protein